MPQRDPQTGQFVTGGGNYDLSDATDVLTIYGGWTIDDGTNDSAGDEYNSVAAITFQKDCELIGMEITVKAQGQEVADSSSSALPGRSDAATAEYQVATSSTFVTDRAGNEGGYVGPGVYHHGWTQAAPPLGWEDDTNGTGGVAPGTQDKETVFLHRDQMVNAETSPNAGSQLHINAYVASLASTGGSVNFDVTVRVWVLEDE